MPMNKHEWQTDAHRLHRWAYADAAEREAATGFVPGDVHKVSLQEDNGSYWRLIDDSPVTWQQIGGTDDAALKIANNLSDVADVDAVLENLNLVPGSDIQPYSGKFDTYRDTVSPFVESLLPAADSDAFKASLDLGTASEVDISTDGTFASPDNTHVPTALAVSTLVASRVAGLLEFVNSIDASGNPNYPAANKGDVYVVAPTGGKVGGASGKSVDVGDLVLATADNAGGTEGSVGSSWVVMEHNLVGALLAANNLSDITSPSAARANLGLAALAVLSSVGTSQIDDNSVTFAKMKNATGNSKLVGSGDAGAGADYEEVSLGSGLQMSGTTLSVISGVGAGESDLITWFYADRAARLAATGFGPSDVGRFAKQVDSGLRYQLVDDSPITWAPPGCKAEYITITTASLAVNANETGTIDTGQGALLRFVTPDRACRIRIYATAAARTADASRVVGAVPLDTPISGLLYELVATASGEYMVRNLAPMVNGDAGRTGTVYYNIENQSAGTHTVQVVLEF